jgi:hypothetical protein
MKDTYHVQLIVSIVAEICILSTPNKRNQAQCPCRACSARLAYRGRRPNLSSTYINRTPEQVCKCIDHGVAHASSKPPPRKSGVCTMSLDLASPQNNIPFHHILATNHHPYPTHIACMLTHVLKTTASDALFFSTGRRLHAEG